jgi:hypothetical protein
MSDYMIIGFCEPFLKTVRGAVNINYWWIPYAENVEGSC